MSVLNVSFLHRITVSLATGAKCCPARVPWKCGSNSVDDFTNFAGAIQVSDVNCAMTTRALLTLVGFLVSCAVSFAQQIERPTFELTGSTARVPTVALSDAQPFSFGANWVQSGTSEFLPAPVAVKTPAADVAQIPAKDSANKLLDLHPNAGYATGEIGVLYGKSFGKFGREYKQGYIMSEVGNDKFHLSVGASYEESSGRVPRLGR
jgi:hypothetical protein